MHAEAICIKSCTLEFQEIHVLIELYLSGKASAEEQAIVENWYETVNGAERDFNTEHLRLLKQDIWLTILNHAGEDHTGIQDIKVEPLFSYLKYIAAVFCIALGIGLYYYTKPGTYADGFAMQHKGEDLSPGGNRAVLTLADGSTINLTDVKNGKLAEQAGIAINKTAEGKLVYTEIKATGTKPVYNTIKTPRGGQYQVILPDGTAVWINSATVLKYPALFSGKERSVQLEGEAYFEVAKNEVKPFRVISSGQTVEVLGTHFNVSAYPEEEAIRTTLLEGGVKVVTKLRSALLMPGQQSVVEGENIEVDEASMEEAIAWKNGMFQFEKADIKSIMNQISRWYNVDVVYAGKIPQAYYKGKVSRNVNVSEVFKILALSGINFKIEGNKIIVK